MYICIYINLTTYTTNTTHYSNIFGHCYEKCSNKQYDIHILYIHTCFVLVQDLLKILAGIFASISFNCTTYQKKLHI